MSTRFKIAVRLVPVLLVLFALKVQAQDVISFGPSMHYNFGDRKPKVSWGVEASVWWYKTSVPYSANIGFDRRKGNTTIFLQGQTGIGIAGVSAGPYLAFRKEERAIVGLQVDYWANYFVGANLRYRYSTEGKNRALGLYLRLPFDPDASDNEESEGWDWD